MDFLWLDLFLEARVEILKKICRYFGPKDDNTRTFQNQLTFSYIKSGPLRPKLPSPLTSGNLQSFRSVNLKKKYGVLDISKKQTKLTILSTEGAQDSEFRLFFGRIQDAIIYFRDLLTFSCSYTTYYALHSLILSK